MKVFLSLLAIAAGGLSALTMLVFLIAASPNSSEQELGALSLLMWGVGIVGLACAVFATFAVLQGRYRRAAFIGAAPIPLSILLVIVLIVITS